MGSRRHKRSSSFIGSYFYDQRYKKRDTTIVIVSEDSVVNRSIVYGERPDPDKLKKRVRSDRLAGDPLPCLLRRVSESGRTYFQRATAVKAGPDVYRAYGIDRRGRITSPRHWVGHWLSGPYRIEDGTHE